MGDAEQAKDKALIEAVYDWWADNSPDDPNDARLMKALWTHNGDIKEPCPECDGECGESCAPITVGTAHRLLDRFTEEWLQKRGITSEPTLKTGGAA